MPVCARLECVVPNRFRQRFGHLVSVVHLALPGHIHADGEVIESDVLDSFNRWVEGNYTQRSVAFYKSLRRQRWSHATHWLANLVCVSHVAEVQLIDKRCANSLRPTEICKLSATPRDGIEARNIGAALRCRIGIIQLICIAKIVGGKVARFRRRVQSERSFVICEGLVFARGREHVASDVWRRNVLEQSLRRSRPGAIRNNPAWTDARS